MTTISELDNLLSASETAYSFIDKISNFRSKSIISLIVSIIFAYYSISKGAINNADIFILISTIGVMFYAVISAVESMKNFFFPPISFAFGANVVVERRRQAVFRNLFWGVLVAGVLGIAVNIVTK